MKKFIKNNKKFVEGFIFGALLFIGIVTLVAYTATEITYTPSDTSWNVSDVKSALDDLYILANTCTVTRSGSNNKSAVYECSNLTGIGTMIECWQGEAGLGIKCDGGSRGPEFWNYVCTKDSSSYVSMASANQPCSLSASSANTKGGGMPETISCSCD